VVELNDFNSEEQRRTTLALVHLALGDALLGGPLTQSLELPRTAARDVAEALLIESAAKAGIFPPAVQG
jgi:hypothetical protein